MISSFESLEFSFPWRAYQKKFLTNLDDYINDNHLHLIAPPGSGKTILGLEIVRRIGGKTLVLCPTITIRNQWEDRLQEFFTKDCDYKEFSFDISQPSDITFSTYQAIHAFYKKQTSEIDFLAFFKHQGIQTLVLDEAHHLKNEWWKCLNAIKQDQDLTIVALTATPPYDSGSAEILRYFELCGPVDDEIAVPDLVKEGDLCPHQDFVHLSIPDDYTINYIVEFRKKVAQLSIDIQADVDFQKFITNHRFLQKTELHLEEIYKNPTYFSSILIYLNATGNKIRKEKLEVLGFKNEDSIDFPEFNNHWLEILLNHLFFVDKDKFPNHDTFIVEWAKRLKKLGVLKTKRIDLVGGDEFYKVLSTSPSKLNSIVEIIGSSGKDLKKDLRAVVLTDYIRKEYLNTKDDQLNEINKLGVLPIFHRLRASISNKETIATLTGSIVIISKKTVANLDKIFPKYKYSLQVLESDKDFVIIRDVGSQNNSIVEIVTELFQKGYIKILIGTKSLLGEGWDAPSINTLILASFVGSFVSSNQMRGRAIRSMNGHKNKTAVIWHLACLDPSDEKGGQDYETLQRRFSAFMGVSTTSPFYIESGLDRLNINKVVTKESVLKLNQKSMEKAINRKKISSDWKQAISSGTGLVRELKKYHSGKLSHKKQKQLYYRDMVAYSFIEILTGLTFFLPEFFLKNLSTLLSKGWWTFLYTLIGVFFVSFGLKTYRAVKLYISYGRIHKSMESMGWAVLETMFELNYLKTSKNKLKVEVKLNELGTVSCFLLGSSNYESSIFIKALEEIVSPIENPRYLITRKKWYKKVLGIKTFFVVPSLFGDKKERALIFLKHWNKKIGQSMLIYTRQKQGRRTLLKARILHISKAHEKPTKKAVIWK